jgi:hypothetical protein
MLEEEAKPVRFVGLDVHKHYLVATAVDADKNEVMPLRRVHDSGQTHWRGGITKAGRRDIRAAMVESAHVASRFHPRWQAELARLEPRLGRNKAIVAYRCRPLA